MLNEKYPRRVFIKSSAAAVAITLTTDAKVRSDEEKTLGSGDTGHVYMYMEDE